MAAESLAGALAATTATAVCLRQFIVEWFVLGILAVSDLRWGKVVHSGVRNRFVTLICYYAAVAVVISTPVDVT